MKYKIFIGFSKWKTMFLKKYFDQKILLVGGNRSKKRLKKIIYSKKVDEIYFWGYNNSYKKIIDICFEKKIKKFFVEDGFIRSNCLGSSKSFPLSLSVDSLGMHFDYYRSTDIEFLLNNYVCSDLEITQAKAAIERIKHGSFTKYNLEDRTVDDNIFTYGSDKPKILIVSQVPTDKSIFYSGFNSNNNNVQYFLNFVLKNHKDAEIVYKTHPDMSYNTNDLKIIKDYGIKVLDKAVYTKCLFNKVDAVYTISSLLGFEALLHGVKDVFCLGCPFYSGWGLTKDNIKNIRRTKKLSLEEVFFISYIKYPIYRNEHGNKTDIFQTFDILNYGK